MANIKEKFMASDIQKKFLSYKNLSNKTQKSKVRQHLLRLASSDLPPESESEDLEDLAEKPIPPNPTSKELEQLAVNIDDPDYMDAMLSDPSFQSKFILSKEDKRDKSEEDSKETVRPPKRNGSADRLFGLLNRLQKTT